MLIGHWNFESGFGTGIGNWDFRLGLGIGIRIGDSGLIWRFRLGIRIGNLDWGLDMGLGDWILELEIMIRDLGLGSGI